jgi:antibiotic biosynthesis monooxygenase (ABM) superfamily enzyme
MFNAVVTFERADTTAKYFYHEYENHPVILEIQKRFQESLGYIGKTILIDEEHKFEIAMQFDCYDNFMEFVNSNKDILEQRNQLVSSWCEQNNHTFAHRFESI